MKALVWILVIQIVYYDLNEFVDADDEDSCKIKKQHLAPFRLKYDLLCGYDRTIRPRVNHESNITVVIKMVLKSFAYEMLYHTMEVNNWLVISWKDDHLKWKPEEYEGIESIHISSDEIWVPDISIYNRVDQSQVHTVISTVDCILFASGGVVCVPPTKQSALCVPNLKKYPFDIQNCTLRYGSWVQNGEKLNIKQAKNAVSQGDFEENPEFKLLNVSVVRNAGIYKCCPNKTFPFLNYHFVFQRYSSAIAAVYIIPAIVLIFLTLVSLWLSVESSDRLCVCCSNLIIHFLYIQSIWWTLPSGGKETPLIFIYSRDSLLLAGLVLIITVLLRTLQGSKEQTPHWISAIVTTVVDSRPGKVLFLFDTSRKAMASAKGDEDAIKIVDNPEIKTRKEWVLFAKLIDKLCFLAYVIVYFCMFIGFLP